MSFPKRTRLRGAALAQEGFTLILALSVMFVTSLLLAAAFTGVDNEILSTRRDNTQKQAYYAALAGVQEFEYQLQANPDYWEKCEGPKSTVPEESGERYEVTVLKAKGVAEASPCPGTNPFTTIIDSEPPLVNTFRIKSKGVAGSAERSLIATFKVTGFLNFIYFTNFETEDPSLYKAPTGCEGAYHSEWSPKGLACATITFTTGDSVNGPLHTNDATKVEGEATFGREGENPPDAVEINGGTYPEDTGENCKGGKPVFNTANGCYTTKGEMLVMPESDTSLDSYVESANQFTGETRLLLNGTTNKISITWFKENGEKVEEPTHSWPKNGLIYVKSRACGFEFKPFGNDDTAEELEVEKGCGNVYVSGTYSEPLTIAAEDDLTITGNIYPTSVAGKLGTAPSGTATVGLIAGEYVRVYHPVAKTYTVSGTTCNRYKVGKEEKEDKYLGSHTCEYTNSLETCDSPTNLSASEDPNGWGSLSNPWIYAAILSTSHSFLVDNFRCAGQLGELNVYGAIAQDYRGIVGLIGTSGYLKNYEYDTRLATDEPPYFLAPLRAGWKVIRETAPQRG
jgi:hypothetical protein